MDGWVEVEMAGRLVRDKYGRWSFTSAYVIKVPVKKQ